MGFSRHEYWSGLPGPPPGDRPNPGRSNLHLQRLRQGRQILYRGTPGEAPGFLLLEAKASCQSIRESTAGQSGQGGKPWRAEQELTRPLQRAVQTQPLRPPLLPAQLRTEVLGRGTSREPPSLLRTADCSGPCLPSQQLFLQPLSPPLDGCQKQHATHSPRCPGIQGYSQNGHHKQSTTAPSGPPSGAPPLADLGSRTEELGNLPQVTRPEAIELVASLLAFQWPP